MLTDAFSYVLPEELIANYPAETRTASRLLGLNAKTGEITHNKFIDLKNFIQPNDLLVINNTRVIPARIFGHKPSGGKVEILIERIIDEQKAIAYLKASKSLKPNTIIKINTGKNAQVENIAVLGKVATDDARYLISYDGQEGIKALLAKFGDMPLPPYMKRGAENFDTERYQTVFSKTEGSVAAPTAGLHFDLDLLAELKAKGVDFAEVTLHIGSGTFLPIRVTNIEQHKMHVEQIEVNADVCAKILKTKELGGRVIAVGTTAVRAIETAALAGELKPFKGETNLFVKPGFKFNFIDAMITNFHLPCSTLLILVCTMAGKENVLKAYAAAVAERYRFYSYGDAMFIHS